MWGVEYVWLYLQLKAYSENSLPSTAKRTRGSDEAILPRRRSLVVVIALIDTVERAVAGWRGDVERGRMGDEALLGG